MRHKCSTGCCDIRTISLRYIVCAEIGISCRSSDHGDGGFLWLCLFSGKACRPRAGKRSGDWCSGRCQHRVLVDFARAIPNELLRHWEAEIRGFLKVLSPGRSIRCLAREFYIVDLDFPTFSWSKGFLAFRIRRTILLDRGGKLFADCLEQSNS